MLQEPKNTLSQRGWLTVGECSASGLLMGLKPRNVGGGGGSTYTCDNPFGPPKRQVPDLGNIHLFWSALNTLWFFLLDVLIQCGNTPLCLKVEGQYPQKGWEGACTLSKSPFATIFNNITYIKIKTQRGRAVTEALAPPLGSYQLVRRASTSVQSIFRGRTAHNVVKITKGMHSGSISRNFCGFFCFVF